MCYGRENNVMPTVYNATQLVAAFNAAKTPTTILLAPGNYGDVALRYDYNNYTTILKSLNINNQATFDSITFSNVSNVQIQDITISHALLPSESLWTPAISVQNSSDIYFVGLDVHGSLNGTSFDDGNGFTITNSRNIAILDSKFSELNNVLSINSTTGLVIAGDTVTASRTFLVGVDVHNGLFELNYLHDMMPNYGAGDHPDFFQIATGSVAGPSSDLTFRSNVMLEKMGDYIGGFYIQSEQFAEGVHHSNIVIDNNYFFGNYRHAVSLTGVDNATITNNTIVDNGSVNPSAAIYLKDVDGAVIDRNIEPLIVENRLYANSGVTITNNVDIWDPQFKIGVAVSSVLNVPVDGAVVNLSSLGAKAGSIAATLGAGYKPVAQVGNLTTSESASIVKYKAVLTEYAKTSTAAAFDLADDGNLFTDSNFASVADRGSPLALQLDSGAGNTVFSTTFGDAFARTSDTISHFEMMTFNDGNGLYDQPLTNIA